MKYRCTGSPVTGECNYTFDWEDVPYTFESYLRLPQEHKDHLIANKHNGFIKVKSKWVKNK